MTGSVLVLVLVTKFLAGAWIAIAAMAVIYADDGRHPAALRPGRRASSTPAEEDAVLPARNHAIVLVQQGAPADAAGARLRPGAPGRTR